MVIVLFQVLEIGHRRVPKPIAEEERRVEAVGKGRDMKPVRRWERGGSDTCKTDPGKRVVTEDLSTLPLNSGFQSAPRQEDGSYVV